jgi:hypothetical protein
MKIHLIIIALLLAECAYSQKDYPQLFNITGNISERDTTFTAKTFALGKTRGYDLEIIHILGKKFKKLKGDYKSSIQLVLSNNDTMYVPVDHKSVKHIWDYLIAHGNTITLQGRIYSGVEVMNVRPGNQKSPFIIIDKIKKD